MIDENDKITVKTAYMAMFKFLEHEYEMTNSDDIGALLGSMSLLGDGNPADPAAWSDWLNSIQIALNEDCDIRLHFISNNE